MELLETLTQIPSVPGREARIRQVIQEYLEEKTLFDRIEVDPLGSLIAYRAARPESGKQAAEPQKVFLAAS